MDKKTKQLNRRNNELDKQIRAENQEAFTDMICYLRGAAISEYDQELVRQDLTEMVLAAQQRGEGIEAVIGGDYKSFCDQVIASLPPKTARQKLLDLLDIVCRSLSILGLIFLVFAKETRALLGDLFAGAPPHWGIAVSVGDLIAAVVIIAAAVIIVRATTRSALRATDKKRRVLKGMAIGAGAMIAFLLIARLGGAVLFTVNILAVCAAILALFIAHKLLERL